MRPYDELVAEAASADVTGWGFGWLRGRATEERPPWGYARLMAERLSASGAALDLDTGGGEVLAEAQSLPPVMCATESWPPNAQRARALLQPRGVAVHETRPGEPLPFADATFDLVTCRHPVATDWSEVHRVLVAGGSYLGQHVGPASARELIEVFLGPLDDYDDGRDPQVEVAAAERAGMTVTDLQTARCRMEFHDIGAVVFTLRKCVWWVPDFDVDRYDATLRALDVQIREQGSFVAHSTRHLIEATR